MVIHQGAKLFEVGLGKGHRHFLNLTCDMGTPRQGPQYSSRVQVLEVFTSGVGRFLLALPQEAGCLPKAVPPTRYTLSDTSFLGPRPDRLRDCVRQTHQQHVRTGLGAHGNQRKVPLMGLGSGGGGDGVLEEGKRWP